MLSFMLLWTETSSIDSINDERNAVAYNGPQKLDNMLSYSKSRKMEVQGYYEDEICIGI